jgi:hypothetical protein
VVRLLLIEQYGGYWVDSTIIAYCNFDSLLGLDINLYNNNIDLFAYYLPKWTTNSKYPVIENWFFGARPGSPFITMWKTIFFSMDSYLDSTEYYKDIEKKEWIYKT